MLTGVIITTYIRVKRDSEDRSRWQKTVINLYHFYKQKSDET